MTILGNIFKWILLFAVALIIQETIIPKIAIFGFYPDLVLILLFILSVQYGRMAGIWGGFFIGLLIDVTSAGILGVNALAKTIIGGAAGFFERRNIAVDQVLQLILLLFAVIIHDIIIYIPNIYDANETLMELPKILVFESLPRAVYTTIVAEILFIASDFLFPFKSRR
jgi:rod shape-determining protein MreD